MRPPSAASDGASPSGPSLGFWLGCAAAVALLLALAFVASGRESKGLPDPAQASREAHRLPALAAVPDAMMPVDLYRFALNALLLPLLDDAEPPRWSDMVIGLNCGPGTSVLIDGEPLVAGHLVPATAFSMRWNMRQCAPMGGNVELSGSVELAVFHEDAGLGAIVMPGRLLVDSYSGRAWLRGPFAAEAALTASAVMP